MTYSVHLREDQWERIKGGYLGRKVMLESRHMTA